jgi:hypothetical protein
MHRLLAIGFQPAGSWSLVDGRLQFTLARLATQANILYAFACDGQVMYVGKTTQPLARRMAAYRTPGATQSTNIANHRRIVACLEADAAVDILALPDNGLMHYGQFHLNLAEGLEDDLIRKIAPPWNGGRTEAAPVEAPAAAPVSPASTGEPAGAEPELPVSATFTFILQKTYLRMGFFNVGVDAQHRIGAEGDTIELFLGDATQPTLGTINRRANTNATPRIMGGTPLRRWFETEGLEMGRIEVGVLSPTSIRLRALPG